MSISVSSELHLVLAACFLENKDVTGALVQALVDILANARPTNEAALCLATLETSEDVLRKYEQVVSGSSSASEDTLLDPPIQILEQHMKYLEVDMESANAFLLSLFNTYQVCQSSNYSSTRS